jgi:hypothetical protein
MAGTLLKPTLVVLRQVGIGVDYRAEEFLAEFVG